MLFNLLFSLILSIFGYTTEAQENDRFWFEIADQMSHADSFREMKEILDTKAPGFREQLVQDSKNHELLNLWGLSRNVDESYWSKGEKIRTVPAKVIQYFNSILKVDYDQDQIFGHAGLTHTYGYMMSNLSTPFGYKRARYVNGEIEAGFGMPEGTFSGLPPQGTLLSNLTRFAGSIAFNEPAASKLPIRRLVECVETPTHSLELRTDIVNFTHKNTRGNNTALLVYSIDFHAKDQPPQPRLITVFPVDSNFGNGIFKDLGDRKAIKLKYNAALPVSIPQDQMIGKRFIISE